jgi:outer membrane protein assembly factor BamB
VIIGSCAESVYSLDRITGELIWVYDTSGDGPPPQFHGEPLLLGDRIVISSDSDTKGHLYSFDTGSGELLWKVPFDYGVATSPLLIDDRLVVVSSAGDVAAIETKSGRIVWRVTPLGALNPSPFIPSPASAAHRIFVADNTNRVLGLDAADGATLWRNTLSGRTNASLIVIGEELLAGTDDGTLHRIDVQSGEVKKRTKLGGTPHGTPVRSDGLLLVLVSSRGKSRLVALDIATHEVRWEQKTRKEWSTYRPLVTGSVVVVGNEDKDLCAFDRATGERRWCRPVGEVPRGLGISQDGTLYVGSLSGVVQAFRIGASGTR